jgi:hypothetical protein
MQARTLGPRGFRRPLQPNLLELRPDGAGGRRRARLRRSGVPLATPHDRLVQKVLERMMIDEGQRVAS